MNKKLLILDDEPSVLEALAVALEDIDCEILKHGDPYTALDAVKAHAPMVVLTDLKMPGMDGMQVLQRIRETAPGTQVIMITGHGSIEDAVTAIKHGAYDFLSKPFKSAEIEVVVRRAFEKAQLVEENDQLRQSLHKARMPVFAEGQSPLFRELLESAALAAQSEANILILGESGTGKEILALYVASHSPRALRPFVTVNCAAIPENLMESEFFGHKRGAFTGAHQDRKGRFQEAHTGTIFLDEIGELPLPLQAKLLRVVQQGEVTPVGGMPHKVDVRILAATNKPLQKMVESGGFREDLYYRLNVFPLKVPPLRQRMEDLPMYAAFFIDKYCRKNHRPPVAIGEDTLRILEGYSWPGNLRELENVIERAIILTRGDEIIPTVLPPELTGGNGDAAHVHFPRGMKLEDIEWMAIQQALQRHHGDRARTADELGIGERTLYRRLSEMQAREGQARETRPT
jgi:DNA-binding NtrC family response regulator